MSDPMELSQEALERIGDYVRRHLPAWLSELGPRTVSQRELDLHERTVRVEEELKSQREIIQQGFEFMEKRFEQVDKQFDDLHNHMNRWMTVMTLMIGLIGIAVTVSNLVG